MPGFRTPRVGTIGEPCGQHRAPWTNLEVVAQPDQVDEDSPDVVIDTPRDEYPEQWEADVVLRDGSTCHIRPIRPSDAERMKRFHESLSERTIYFRFFAPYPELSKKDLERFTNVDYHDRVGLIATVGDEMVGVGRYDRLNENDAEVAFTVRDDYQGRGLGSVLLEHIAAAARERGIRRFVADVLPENRKMAATFSHAGYHVAQELRDGVLKVAFEIDPTDALRAVAVAREQRADSRSVERLLNPTSVAVVGASPRGHGLGNQVLNQLIEGHFEGAILPIHRSAKTIAKLPVYPSIPEAPAPIDLAILAVPLDQVPEVVSDCGESGVHGLIVMSSGYHDLDDGLRARRELVAKVRGYGMRLIGPNAMGVLNTDPHTSLRAIPQVTVPGSGRVALYCQSAPIAIGALERLAARKLGVSSAVAVGDRGDVSGHDLLQYWLGESRTDVVLMYLETMADPRKFIRVARDVGRHKPVVVVRSGRTSQAFPLGPRHRRTELPAKAVDQLIENAGVIETTSLGSLVDVGGMLACQPLPAGSRLTVVGDSHELVSLAADTVATAGFLVSDRLVLRSGHGDSYQRTLAGIVDNGETDAILVIHVPPSLGDDHRVRTEILKASHAASVPIVAVLHSKDGRNTLLEDGEDAAHGAVPAFGTVEEAVEALSRVRDYAQWLQRERGVIPDYLDLDVESARTLMGDIQARNVSRSETFGLSASEVAELLGCYGIEVWPARPVANEDDAVAEADELGWPVVLKSADPRLKNRGTVAGVRLHLENEAALRAAFLSLSANLDADARSQFVVQRMAPPGAPCVIRTHEDPVFGPVISFGLGGVMPELLNDRSYQVPPITDLDAARLIRLPGTSSLLFGHGGNEPADTAALEDMIVRLGLLADDFPQVVRLDLNPVVATPRGPAVLGAAAWVRPSDVREMEARRLTSW